MYILQVLGLPYSNDELELSLEDSAINNMKQYISKDKKNIIVNIGSSQLRAIYDINKLNKVLELINEDNNYIFIGDLSDSINMQYITIPHINMVGKISLQETAALVSLSDLYIGNDSGAMHMAAAFKIPIIEISREAKDKTRTMSYPASSVKRFHPWRSKYIIIQPNTALDKCKTVTVYAGCASDVAHCINQIEPEEIVKAYKEINK